MRLGLLGWPLEHSRSPRMHAAALAAAGIDGRYEAIPLPPDRLAAGFAQCRRDGFRGVNVTIPHKEAVLHLCDAADPVSRRTGAVNTVTFAPDGVATGTNTDVGGFLDSLRLEGAFDPGGRTALVLGAGGAARAVIAALQDAGVAHLVIANRHAARAEALAGELGADWRLLTRAALEPLRPDLVVNATAAGLGAERGTPGWEPAFLDALPFDAWPAPFAFDLVYAPADTAFLARAAAAGCRALGGLDMLARQGALAFERWTGVPAADVLPAMRGALS